MIKQYEYWLDDAIGAKQIVSIAPIASLELKELPLIGLTTGSHRLNLRFLDTNGRYSAVLTQRIEAFSTNSKINGFEYWMDDSYVHRKIGNLSPSSFVLLEQVDLTGLTQGFHRLNIRFSDASGKWSAIQSVRLFKSVENVAAKNKPVQFRYWLGNDVSKAVVKSMENGHLETSINLSSFPEGYNNQLNIQVQDALGLWSSIQSLRIFNAGSGPVDKNVITGFRYWLDDGFVNYTYQEVRTNFTTTYLDESINLSANQGKDHRLRLQFQDAQGLWSSVLTDTLNVVFSGLTDVSNDALCLYPNPNHGEFTLSTRMEWTNVDVRIVSIIGKTVYQKSFEIYRGGAFKLNDVSPGMYFLRITEMGNGHVQFTRKFIVSE